MEFDISDPGEARTLDPLIKSQLLYQLSYGVMLQLVIGLQMGASRIALQRYAVFLFLPNFFLFIFRFFHFSLYPYAYLLPFNTPI